MNNVKIMVAAGTAAIAGTWAVPSSAQEVRGGPNGTWEVHFPGPCTVYYDRAGNRTFATPACIGDQRRVADAAIRARLGNGYNQPGYNYGWGWGSSEPQVRINPGGWGTVNLRNGCIVTFNRDGYRMSDTRPCNSQMRAYATQLFRSHMYGGSGYPGQGYPGYGGGYGGPRIDLVGNMIRVQMTGTNCTYMYTTGGNHVSTLGNQCNGTLRGIANEAVRDYRRRNGW
jgi:hypothetical protein